MSDKNDKINSSSKNKAIPIIIAAAALSAVICAGVFVLPKAVGNHAIPDTDTTSAEAAVVDDTAADTVTDPDPNSDSDTGTDTNNVTDTDTDSGKKKTDKDASSAVTSSKPGTDKDTSSSASSKTQSTSSAARVSQPVTNYTTTSQSYQGTSTGGNSTGSTENTTNGTGGNIDPGTAASPNSTTDFIDPNSVGKKYPISYVGTEEKKVSISFDASWGNDKTQTILDTLDEYDIKSTFFLVGIWVRAYPDDVKKIAAAGHDIGNHSNTHPDLTLLDTAGIRREMETCSSDIEALTGKRPTLFRNPFGAYDDRVIGTALGLGMDCIQWDVDTLDWTNNSGSEICARIRNNIKNGSIILMHNAGGSTADSLPMIIQTIYDLGYEIVPISELLPDGDYTTDITGRLTPEIRPETPSENEIQEDPQDTEEPQDSENTENNESENESSDKTSSSNETDVSDRDSPGNTDTDNSP